MTTHDVLIKSDGSKLVGFTPVSKNAKEWFEANVETASYQWLGNTVWVEDRYAQDLLDGLTEAGLSAG